MKILKLEDKQAEALMKLLYSHVSYIGSGIEPSGLIDQLAQQDIDLPNSDDPKEFAVFVDGDDRVKYHDFIVVRVDH